MTTREAAVFRTAKETVTRMRTLAVSCKERWRATAPWDRPESSRRSIVEDLKVWRRRPSSS